MTPNPSVLPSPFKSFVSAGARQADITFYGTSVVVAAGATEESTINIDAGTDFYWFASSFQVSTDGVAFEPSGNLIVPLVNVTITDSGIQRALIQSPVPVTTIASFPRKMPNRPFFYGANPVPYRLPLPRLFTANSLIDFTWISVEATETRQIDFVMHGFRLPPAS